MSDYHKRLSEVEFILEGWEYGGNSLTKPQLDKYIEEKIELTKLIKDNCIHTTCYNVAYMVFNTDEYGTDHNYKLNDIWCEDCDSYLIHEMCPKNATLTALLNCDLINAVKFYEYNYGAIKPKTLKKLGVYFTEKTERTYYRTQK